MKKTNLRKDVSQAGITLIALVVTIVVLLILAAISINLILGDDGIFGKAVDAKDKWAQAEENDQAALNSLYEQMEEILNGTGTGSGSGTGGNTSENDKYLTTSQVSDLNENTKPYLPSSSYSVSTEDGENTLADGLVIKDGVGNEYVWIEVPTSIYNDSSINNNEINKPANAEDYTNIRYCLEKYSEAYGESNYKDYWYYYESSTTYSKDPITGAEYTNGSSVANGTLTLTKGIETNTGCGLNYEQYTQLYKAMLSSVYTNGGFYIGRYEAGIEGSTAKRTSGASIEGITPVSQKHEWPIIYVTCSEAQGLASRINVPSGYQSSLMFGVQWDLVLRYLESKGMAQAELKTDSKSWGNYYDSSYTITDPEVNKGEGTIDHTTSKSILLTTGADTDADSRAKFVKQNIYDLAGNVYEETLQRTSSSGRPCAGRGGNCAIDGFYSPASYRGCSSPTASDNSVGFRVTLF